MLLNLRLRSDEPCRQTMDNDGGCCTTRHAPFPLASTDDSIDNLDERGCDEQHLGRPLVCENDEWQHSGKNPEGNGASCVHVREETFTPSHMTRATEHTRLHKRNAGCDYCGQGDHCVDD